MSLPLKFCRFSRMRLPPGAFAPGGTSHLSMWFLSLGRFGEEQVVSAGENDIELSGNALGARNFLRKRGFRLGLP